MADIDQNIDDLHVGEDRTLEFSLSGPIDATTATEIEYGAKAGSTALFTTKALTSGVVATDADTITVQIDASDTTGEEPGIYLHELRLTNSSGKISTVATGTLTLIASNV